jgi:hypothetical protein
MIRKKIKWATKRRKGGMRVWKTKWIMVAQQTPKVQRETGQHKAEKAAAVKGGEKKS